MHLDGRGYLTAAQREEKRAAIAIQKRIRGKEERRKVDGDLWHRIAHGDATEEEHSAAEMVQRIMRGWHKRNDLFLVFKQWQDAAAGKRDGCVCPITGRLLAGVSLTNAKRQINGLDKHVGKLRKPSLGEHGTRVREAFLLKAAEQGDTQVRATALLPRRMHQRRASHFFGRCRPPWHSRACRSCC